MNAHTTARGRPMKRLFAILAFVAGGFAAEMRAPLQCVLRHEGAGGLLLRPAKKRAKV